MKKLTPEEALEAIKEATKNGSIKFAESTMSDALDGYIAEITEAILGKGSRARVSDESRIGDFGRTAAEVVTKKLGIAVTGSTPVHEAARLLAASRKQLN